MLDTKIELLDRLKSIFEKYPHLRFAQVLSNIYSLNGGDIYYLNDDKFLQLVQTLENILNNDYN